MSKTKILVKDDQVLVDVEWLFEEVRGAKGDWKAVEQMLMDLLESARE